jgi:hypothetical protein
VVGKTVWTIGPEADPRQASLEMVHNPSPATAATDTTAPTWLPAVTRYVLNVVEEHIHDLDSGRRRARSRTLQAIEAARPRAQLPVAGKSQAPVYRPLGRRKKLPVGWIGPAKGEGPGTSLGKGRWRVIDSTGQWIAAGFETRAHALHWIDGFHLMQAGHRLSGPDEKWIFAHWYRALPARPVPKPEPSTETGNASVLTCQKLAEAQAVAGDQPQQIQAPVTHRTWSCETRKSRGG